MKHCSKCKNLKEYDSFGKRSDKPHLYRSHCNACITEHVMARQDSANLRRKARYQADEEYRNTIRQQSSVQWKTSKEKMQGSHRTWVLANKEKVRAYGRYYRALRRSLEKLATPQWVDKTSLKQIYKNCPKGFHVDHIIPLNGKEICGLHVPWNLQYLTAKDNLSKGNRLTRNGG
jgi:ribosomal protein L19E